MKEAGLPLSTRCESRAEAQALAARGYRHVMIGDDLGSIEAGFARFADQPANSAREAVRSRGALAQSLEGDRLVLSGFLMTPDARYATALASRSAALWIDGEHGPFTPEEIVSLVTDLKQETSVVVRVTRADDPNVERYAEAGAEAIVAPSVESPREARRFVERVKASGSGTTLAVVMIETRRGLERCEEIVAIPGLAWIHQGPFDLAKSLNVVFGSPEHAAAVARIEAAARAAGIPLGGLAPTRSVANARHGSGYRFLTIVSDQESIAGTLRARLALTTP